MERENGVNPGAAVAAPSTGRARTSAPPLLDITGLSFAFPPDFTLEIDAFTLRAGSRVALVGVNGAGKTTWLRLLAGLERPASCARFERRSGLRLGLVRQDPYLFTGTVADNLAYPLRMRRAARSEIRWRAAAMLERLELTHLASRRAEALSGGERKRVALGRALIAEPELLLLDEPDAHLDRASRRVIESLLRGLPGTLVFTTHDLRFAHRLADEFLHLRDGRVVAGMPENVFAGCVLPMTEDPGISRIETSGGIVLRAQGRFAPGPARVAIDPRHLVVSREPLASSMLNHFTGRVTSAHEDDRGIWLEAALGGEQLTAVISRSSYERLGLNLGCAVVVSCKVSAVEVLWPGAPDGNGGPPGGDVDG